jgi:hypothetical protein
VSAPQTADVHEDSRRIELLLADAEAATGPAAWPRVEALITALVDLYGRGLERILTHARATAGDASSELDRRLEDDAIAATLLVLHDLHPSTVEERVARALERLQTELPTEMKLSLAGIEGDTAAVRVQGASPVAAHVIARAVEAAAPELAGIRLLAASEKTPNLVPEARLKRGRTT